MCSFINSAVVALLAVGLVMGILTTRRFRHLREASGLSGEEFSRASAGLFKENAFGPAAEGARVSLVKSVKLQSATFVLATGGIVYIVFVCNAA